MWVPNDERQERRSKLLIYFRYRHFNVYSISYINFNTRIFLDFLLRSRYFVVVVFFRWHRILGALRVFAPVDLGMPSCVASPLLGKVAMCHRINFTGSQKSLGKPNPRFQWVIFRESLGISMLPRRHVFGEISCQKSLKNHRQKWLKMKKSYSQVNVWSTRGGTGAGGPSSLTSSPRLAQHTHASNGGI